MSVDRVAAGPVPRTTPPPRFDRSNRHGSAVPDPDHDDFSPRIVPCTEIVVAGRGRGSRSETTDGSRYVTLTYVARQTTDQSEKDEARVQLVEAEAEYQRSRSDDYVIRRIRDSAIVTAHR